MITKHVTDLKRSKELKEAGLPQEGGLFYWVEFEHNSIYPDNGVGDRTSLYTTEEVNDTSSGRNFWQNMKRGKGVDGIYRAFLSTELNEWLPAYFQTWKLGNFEKEKPGWFCCTYVTVPQFVAKQEQNAKADMILYLVKEGIIKLKG